MDSSYESYGSDAVVRIILTYALAHIMNRRIYDLKMSNRKPALAVG